jgi:hypothetical protein
MKKTYIRVVLLLTTVSATCIAKPSETNALLRLDGIGISIEAEQFFYAQGVWRYEKELNELRIRLSDYKKQKRSDPKEYKIGQTTISKDDITDYLEMWQVRIQEVQSDLKEVKARYTARLVELQKQRAKTLAECGYKDGICEIHGREMMERDIDVSYGFPAPKPEGYSEARLLMFRNSDAPCPGGCVGGPPKKPAVLRRQVCSECSAVRRMWLKEHQVEKQVKEPNAIN